jgi:dTDP-4-amino-4,6-dideoxygalactose transaminase
LGYKRGDFPISEAFADEILSLPMYPELGGKDIEHIVSVITEFVQQNLNDVHQKEVVFSKDK